MHRAGLALLVGWVIGLAALAAMAQGAIPALPPWVIALHLLALPVGVVCFVLSESRSVGQIQRQRP
jgi:hypothetical protein